ncbi:MAG: 6-bladed beta-propeller [Bacteroidales bacterium]|nr:6-bladed beta-propeller [Bacteroidales bacterium]
MKYVFYFLVALLCSACASERKGEREKWQRQRDNIVDVRDKVKEIDTGDILIGNWAQPYVCGRYLVIADAKSMDQQVHVFDKRTFRHVVSFGDKGQGPKEVTVLGTVAWNEERHDFYVTDHGKLAILRYNLDSLLTDPLYAPTTKVRLSESAFPSDYVYVNDTLAYGVVIRPTSVSTFDQTSGRWNLLTGDFRTTDYVHPADHKKRITLAVSLPHQRLVECNQRFDLISLYNLEGELQCNVYGPNWNEGGDREEHFSDADVCGDKLIAAYVGGDWAHNDGARTLLVFSMQGDYLQTLDVGRRINFFCCDEENGRIILSMDDEIQFGYIDLQELTEGNRSPK